jgi:hypothetical protein
MNKIMKIRLYFFASIFIPFVAIEFLPWWLSAPISIVCFFSFWTVCIAAKKYSEELKENT